VTIVYPSARVVTYTPGGAARALSVADSSITYQTNVHYAPQGTPSSSLDGTSLTSTFYYNGRLQPCRISVKTSGAAPSSCADTGNVGNILDLSYNYAASPSNNGNVTGIVNNGAPNRSQIFTYDSLNRVASAATSATFAIDPANCWGESFVYDNQVNGGAWGNLTNINVASSAYNGCVQESLSVIANANNQINGNSYDAAGNMTATSGVAYNYNTENQITSASGVTYTYDGDGKRVEKSNGSLYWYGGQSGPIGESTLTGGSLDEYIFFEGKRIARCKPTGEIDYYFDDRLGTSRVVVSSSGTILDNSDFYPFGGERPVIPPSSGNTFKFTGKERDIESGLDFFGARYMSSRIGRFLSVDLGSPDLVNPQTLNRYTYAMNNPLFYTDPTGDQSVSGDYPLGSVDFNYVYEGRSVDNASLLSTISGYQSEPYKKSVGIGQSQFTPTNPSNGGGCTLGCWSIYNLVPEETDLTLTFGYDAKGNVTGASIRLDWNPHAAFIGPDPSQAAKKEGFPGILAGLYFLSASFKQSEFQKLTPEQLAGLLRIAGLKEADPIWHAILQAAMEERKRRDAQQKAKDDKQKALCNHAAGSCSAPSAKNQSPH
jgi:RHS repeat-associated protein